MLANYIYNLLIDYCFKRKVFCDEMCCEKYKK